ncbi:MAG TPA: FecR domain-containing protein [Polyangiaceae bacterium]|nr:FecR domain-containing protein [Polyangiaceae bacterium]
MIDRCSSALRQLRGGVWPVLDESSERQRRERIATRVLEVQAAVTRRRERGRFALVMSLAALVAGLGAAVPLLRLSPGGFFSSDAAQAELTSDTVRLVAGHASVRDEFADSPLEPLDRGQVRLASQSVLVTPAEDGAELRLWSDAALSIAPSTEVGIVRQRPTREAFEERVRLRSGRVALRVPKLGARGKVSVQTSDALVEVHGTQFSVQVVERPPLPAYTEVDVREGRVLVRSGDQSRFLGAGDHWSSAPPAPSAAIEPEPAPSASARNRNRARHGERRPVATPSELAAQNQLLEDAELARRNGSSLLALRQLDTLIQRFPDAELAHNARVQRFRLLQQLGRDADAAEAARDYLEHHPQGFARAEARELLSPSSETNP